jgi:hypothetical protein
VGFCGVGIDLGIVQAEQIQTLPSGKRNQAIRR